MTARWTLPAFAGYGIELEYAIVDLDSLDVRPRAVEFLRALGGHGASDVERGGIGWSNELVEHVLEVKNVAPTPALDALHDAFQREVTLANRALEPIGACLLPTAMHPWMDPRAESRLWPLRGREIYAAYDRIFNCRRHGWANIQSMHLNLPFADDAQFARLHAAVRLVLPLLPALTASSPIAGARSTGFMDSRLAAYAVHTRAVPSVAGDIIPESVADRADYEARILAPMYRDIAPLDPAGTLRHEWLNARGAIARFERNAIEVRLMDTQECPRIDVALAAGAAAAIRAIYDETWSSLPRQQAVPAGPLRSAFYACIRDAEGATIEEPGYLDVLGLRGARCNAAETWAHLLAAGGEEGAWWAPWTRLVRTRGTLARRIRRAVAGDASRAHLRDVYSRLCACLDRGMAFE